MLISGLKGTEEQQEYTRTDLSGRQLLQVTDLTEKISQTSGNPYISADFEVIGHQKNDGSNFAIKYQVLSDVKPKNNPKGISNLGKFLKEIVKNEDTLEKDWEITEKHLAKLVGKYIWCDLKPKKDDDRYFETKPWSWGRAEEADVELVLAQMENQDDLIGEDEITF